MSAILVTGAAGFIGSHLSERLLGRGDTVIGVDNFDPYYPRALKEANLTASRSNSRFRLVEADIRDRSAMAALLRAHRPDCIVHLAARAGVRPSLEDPHAYLTTNLDGTLNLLLGCDGLNVKHFVFASSSSVYGNSARPPFDESQATDQPESPYAATKKAGEALCFTYHRILKLSVTCLRFFTVFGPRQRPDLAINKFVRLIEAGQSIPVFGDGLTSRDYTYVSDTVDGIVAALDRPQGYEIYNLGRSNPLSLAEMIVSIEKVLGKVATIQRLPDQPGDVRTTCANVRKAQRDLGYQAKISFEEGLSRFVAWRREMQ